MRASVSATVAVVGANGRVGTAIVQRLQAAYVVHPIVRQPGELTAELAARAVEGACVVINAAGVAHIEQPSGADLDRLRAGNVDLPLAIAAEALTQGVSMIHLSSVKAAIFDESSPYARSKREADLALEGEFGRHFAGAGLSLVVVRPLALLFPPLDAGRVARLQFLRWWPAWVTPRVRLPVLAPDTFLSTVETLVHRVLDADGGGGFSMIEFGHRQRGTLRDVGDAMRRSQEREGST
jgi:nucleoside-diphosphate-sugar epimerase